MSTEAWIALIGQTVVIITAIVASFMRTERRMTKLETKVEHVENVCNQVPGISRAVARLQGTLNGPTHIHLNSDPPP